LAHKNRSVCAQQRNGVVPAEYRMFEKLPEIAKPQRAADDSCEIAALVLEPPA
jgi:hypothetical protein